MRRIPTICAFCGIGCGLYLTVKDNQIIGVAPSRAHPISRGRLCVRGWHIHEFVNSPNRLKTPLIKQNGSLRPASWEEALELVASKFDELKNRLGGSGLAVLGSPKCTNEDNFLLMKLARAVLGTNNLDNSSRFYDWPTSLGLGKAFNVQGALNSIAELGKTDVILLVGSNILEQHPIIGGWILDAVDNGSVLIVVDPRRTDIAKFATIHLAPKPGTDLAWLNGLMELIITEGLAVTDFIRDCTENYESLISIFKKYTPSYVEELTGIKPDELRQAARLYAQADRALIVYSTGITQHQTGTANVLGLANLAILTGHVGREGSGILSLREQNNGQGTCDVGVLPDFLSAYQRVDDSDVRAKFEKAWSVELPAEPGITIAEMAAQAQAGKIKGMYIMGENLLVSDPNANLTREALRKLEFLVVQDLFLTETAQLADVVLPAASFVEKNGTFTNLERRIQRVRQAIPPIGDSKPDWHIIQAISNRMGYPMNYDTEEDIFKEITKLTPIYAGVDYRRLEENWGIQWPCPNPHHPGTATIPIEASIDKKAQFSPADYTQPPELPDEEYPFALIAGRIGFHLNTGTTTREALTLRREYPEELVEINPANAQELGIREGWRVKLVSRRGEITAKVRLTESLPQNVLFMPIYSIKQVPNSLVDSKLDPEAKTPEFKLGAAKIELIK